MEPCYEIAFPLVGRTIPVNNGYYLYAAICTHLDDRLPPMIGVHSVGGFNDRDVITLDRFSMLRIRTPLNYVSLLSGLSGRELSLEGHRVMLGAFNVYGVSPMHSLYSRQTFFKDALTEGDFLRCTREAIDRLSIKATPVIPCISSGVHTGAPERRIVVIRGAKVVGFGLRMDDLSLQDSTTLLHQGLGGKRHMGCGIFSPVRDRNAR